MSIHKLTRAQTIHATEQECWAFFSNPQNLSKITPPSLDFRVKSELPREIHAGLMIEYQVRPLLGIPVTWLTEITHVEAGRYFVDEQRVGPYRMWHHEHVFHPMGDGRIEICDTVYYVMPYGWLGDLAHELVVKRELRKIFAFREKTVREMFPHGGPPDSNQGIVIPRA
jgi:ligand-binding SRPBCC domain-containing protein